MGMYCSGNRKGVDFPIGTQSIYECNILHYYGDADTLCHADGLTAINTWADRGFLLYTVYIFLYICSLVVI